MSEEQKRLIEETVENLKHLDKESLLVVKGSVEVLKARSVVEVSVRLSTLSDYHTYYCTELYSLINLNFFQCSAVQFIYPFLATIHFLCFDVFFAVGCIQPLNDSNCIFNIQLSFSLLCTLKTHYIYLHI